MYLAKTSRIDLDCFDERLVTQSRVPFDCKYTLTHQASTCNFFMEEILQAWSAYRFCIKTTKDHQP